MWGDKAKERGRFHPCNVCDKAFKSFQMPFHHKIWQHSGHLLACKGCGKKFNSNSISRHNKLVCGKPHHRKNFCHFSVWGEEERKRTVLARSRKRADILYPLKWKYIVLVFNKFGCLKFIFVFEIPVRRKTLRVSPATNILIIQP